MTQTTPGITTPYGVLSPDVAELVRDTRPELLCPQHRSPCNKGRLGIAVTALIGAATIMLLASVHAFAGPLAPATRLAQEHRACAVVLGLDPSEAPYQHCIESLARTWPQTDPPQLASLDPTPQTPHQKAIAACAAVGRDQDSACVVDLDQTLSDDQQLYR